MQHPQDFDPFRDPQTKLDYARALIRFDDPFKAALEILPRNDFRSSGWAITIADTWPIDAAVVAEIKRLEEAGEAEALLPSKVELARQVYQSALDARAATDKEKLFRLYAELRKMIEKPAPAVNVNNTVAPSVMVVKDYGDNDAWEAKLREQQNKLVANA